MMIHPGTDIVKQAGGLHKYINRPKPLITDSGGFQVFSLASDNYHEEVNERKGQEKELKGSGKKKHQAIAAYDPQSEEKQGQVLKVTEEGVTFRSYKDGKIFLLTPETSIQAQKNLGADIIIPLDELLPLAVSRTKLLDSLRRTHDWEKRSLQEHLKDRKQQAMYAVIHGGIDKELRKISIDTLTAEDGFDGFAIGGSLGKDRDELIDVLQYVVPRVNATGKPNHVLGIGDVESVTRFISLGVDTFDSAYPTRVGRHGHFLVNSEIDPKGVVSLRKERYATLFEPIDPTCNCYTCKNYTAAYLHHLYKMHEPSFMTLSAIHNLHFMYNLTSKIRQQILNDEI
jgi:queuine tRNA-ribosyltransferase